MFSHINRYDTPQNGHPVGYPRRNGVGHQDSRNDGAPVLDGDGTFQKFLGDGFCPDTTPDADQGDKQDLKSEDKNGQDQRGNETGHHRPHDLLHGFTALDMGGDRNRPESGFDRRRRFFFYKLFDGFTPN